MSENSISQSQAAVKGGVVPYLEIDGVMKAVEFYKKAFGATVAFAFPPDDKGRTMHAHLHINGGSLMLSDFFAEHGHTPVKPQGFNVTLPVDDVDQWFKRAVDAGCEAGLAPQDMFWGDRYAQLKDPFGVAWSLNGPKRG